MALKSPFLAGILAHIPEADRGKAETELEALEKGSLRQEDYSRLANEATEAKRKFDALYAENVTWFDANKAALDERTALATRVAELEKTPPKSGEIPADVIRKKDFDTTLADMERGAVAVITEANRLSMEHFKTFGEVLDMAPILADKRVQQIGMRAVYQDLHKDELKAKADAAETARLDAIRKDERDKVTAELAARQQLYPVVGNEPSALDGIEAARAGKPPTPTSVEQMAAEYSRLSAAH